MSFIERLSNPYFRHDPASGELVYFPDGFVRVGFRIRDKFTEARLRRFASGAMLCLLMMGIALSVVMARYFAHAPMWSGDKWSIALVAILIWILAYRHAVSIAVEGLEPSKYRLTRAQLSSEPLSRWMRRLVIAYTVVLWSLAFLSLHHVASSPATADFTSTIIILGIAIFFTFWIYRQLRRPPATAREHPQPT